MIYTILFLNNNQYENLLLVGRRHIIYDVQCIRILQCTE